MVHPEPDRIQTGIANDAPVNRLLLPSASLLDTQFTRAPLGFSYMLEQGLTVESGIPLTKRSPWSQNISAQSIPRLAKSGLTCKFASLDKAPGLASKVDSGSVQRSSDRNRGDPHPTTKTGDPYHASITLGIKGKDRVVSAHVYPNGTVKFSKDYGQVKVDADPDAPEGESALK
uniref:Uncharacterized protein n=1 Tax=Coccidioides posadasii RMSCC 3488 TaxID=454284 RepID=A0A0J6FBJ7_COCPO|nr:hypothetical protein CPAG_03936 [Coccidioides posadasii RMSCC 3488]